jgi:hypothetical protein
VRQTRQRPSRIGRTTDCTTSVEQLASPLASPSQAPSFSRPVEINKYSPGCSRQRVNVHLHHLLFRCRCSSHHLLLRTKNSTYRFRRARNRGGVAPYPQDHIPFHVVQWFSREPAVCVLTFRTIHHDHPESTQGVLAKVTGAPQQPASKFQLFASLAPCWLHVTGYVGMPMAHGRQPPRPGGYSVLSTQRPALNAMHPYQIINITNASTHS